MRVFTKTIKVIGVSRQELKVLVKMIAEAENRGMAEEQIGPSQYLAVEVDDMYACHHESGKSRER